MVDGLGEEPRARRVRRERHRVRPARRFGGPAREILRQFQRTALGKDEDGAPRGRGREHEAARGGNAHAPLRPYGRQTRGVRREGHAFDEFRRQRQIPRAARHATVRENARRGLLPTGARQHERRPVARLEGSAESSQGRGLQRDRRAALRAERAEPLQLPRERSGVRDGDARERGDLHRSGARKRTERMPRAHGVQPRARLDRDIRPARQRRPDLARLQRLHERLHLAVRQRAVVDAQIVDGNARVVVGSVRTVPHVERFAQEVRIGGRAVGPLDGGSLLRFEDAVDVGPHAVRLRRIGEDDREPRGVRHVRAHLDRRRDRRVVVVVLHGGELPEVPLGLMRLVAVLDAEIAVRRQFASTPVERRVARLVRHLVADRHREGAFARGDLRREDAVLEREGAELGRVGVARAPHEAVRPARVRVQNKRVVAVGAGAVRLQDDPLVVPHRRQVVAVPGGVPADVIRVLERPVRNGGGQVGGGVPRLANRGHGARILGRDLLRRPGALRVDELVHHAHVPLADAQLVRQLHRHALRIRLRRERLPVQVEADLAVPADHHVVVPDADERLRRSGRVHETRPSVVFRLRIRRVVVGDAAEAEPPERLVVAEGEPAQGVTVLPDAVPEHRMPARRRRERRVGLEPEADRVVVVRAGEQVGGHPSSRHLEAGRLRKVDALPDPAGNGGGAIVGRERKRRPRAVRAEIRRILEVEVDDRARRHGLRRGGRLLRDEVQRARLDVRRARVAARALQVERVVRALLHEGSAAREASAEGVRRRPRRGARHGERAIRRDVNAAQIAEVGRRRGAPGGCRPQRGEGLVAPEAEPSAVALDERRRIGQWPVHEEVAVFALHRPREARHRPGEHLAAAAQEGQRARPDELSRERAVAQDRVGADRDRVRPRIDDLRPRRRLCGIEVANGAVALERHPRRVALQREPRHLEPRGPGRPHPPVDEGRIVNHQILIVEVHRLLRIDDERAAARDGDRLVGRPFVLVPQPPAERRPGGDDIRLRRVAQLHVRVRRADERPCAARRGGKDDAPDAVDLRDVACHARRGRQGRKVEVHRLRRPVRRREGERRALRVRKRPVRGRRPFPVARTARPRRRARHRPQGRCRQHPARETTQRSAQFPSRHRQSSFEFVPHTSADKPSTSKTNKL